MTRLNSVFCLWHTAQTQWSHFITNSHIINFIMVILSLVGTELVGLR